MAAEQMEVSGKILKRMMNISDECQAFMELWRDDKYRWTSRDTLMLPAFYDAIGEYRDGERVIDWGCGAGRASIGLWNAGYSVTLVDFAPNCLDEHVREKLCESLAFVDHDITKPKIIKAEHGFCVDLLQHISEEQIDNALKTMFESCRNMFFVIGRDGVNNKGYDYWLRKFSNHKVFVHRSMLVGDVLAFHTSGYSGFILRKNFVPNTDDETLEKYLRQNAQLDTQVLEIYPEQEAEVVFLCGGPSLNDYEDEIRKKREAGAKLLTVNGTYQWCLDRGIKPSLHMVLDSQLHNKRFVQPVIDDCKYLIGSCVHPSLFDDLPLDRTFLWHVNVDADFFETYEELFGTAYEDWTPISGGSTVTLRGLYTLKILGLHKNPIDIYGMDSCVLGDDNAHHAYEQKENETDGAANQIVTLTIDQDGENEKSFNVQLWQIAQAKEMIMLRQTIFKDYNKMRVHGPGLIAHLLETGAHLED